MTPSQRVTSHHQKYTNDQDDSDEDRFSQVVQDTSKQSEDFTISSAIVREHCATDIVVVVLAVSRRQEAPSSKFASQSKIEYNILVGDPTLPRGKCARIIVPITTKSVASLLGVDGKKCLGMFHPMKNNKVDGIEQDLGKLQPGDVVRFNSIQVQKHYENDLPTISRKRKHEEAIPTEDDLEKSLLNVIICDLRTSYKYPIAGPPLARLCRIMSESSISETSEFHFRWEANIPMSFETSKHKVLELARYYCEDARPSYFFSNPSLALSTTQACQRRRIKDIITENMMSHVLVKVLRCEREKTVFMTPSKSFSGQRITHATLADGLGNDDIIGIAASVSLERVAGNTPVLPKGISTTLLQAMTEGKCVLLTNVASRSIKPMATGKEYLVLVPTLETMATVLRPEHPYYVTPEIFQRCDVDPHASQPLTQLLSLTQHDSPEKKDTRCVMAIEAGLTDIIVDGMSTSLVEGAYWGKPRALSNFLIHRPGISTGLGAIELRPSYRSATLLLDPKIVSREIFVNADSNALKLLCMDVPIEDMIICDDCIDASTHPYLQHVGRVLKSLCEDDVRIRWVLEQEDETNWFVANATLLEV